MVCMQVKTGMLILLLNVVGMGLIVSLTYFLAKGSTRGNIVGWICLVFSLCVFVAPLFVVVSNYLYSFHQLMTTTFHIIISLISKLIIMCCVDIYIETSNTNKECGIHAVSAIVFPHTKRCYVVLLRPTAQGLQHCCKLINYISYIIVNETRD